MKIFLAGATGALGKRLVPLLVAAGHYVIATTRTQDKTEALRAAGAHPVIFDGLDREAVTKNGGRVFHEEGRDRRGVRPNKLKLRESRGGL